MQLPPEDELDDHECPFLYFVVSHAVSHSTELVGQAGGGGGDAAVGGGGGGDTVVEVGGGDATEAT